VVQSIFLADKPKETSFITYRTGIWR